MAATPPDDPPSPSSSSASAADRPLKDGERFLAPSRRPDGTLRKPIRIRAGYTPQDEVALYQSKGALFRRGTPQVPPGYDPVGDAPQKPKTKSAKENQRRKEKKHQAAAAASLADGDSPNSPQSSNPKSQLGGSEDIDAVTQQINSLSVSSVTSNNGFEKESTSEKVGIEKRIRALRKKIRLTESIEVSLTSKESINAELAEKLSKLEIWRSELSDLEAQKGSL